jgi:hypothetical protein
MMRISFILFLILAAGYLFLQGRVNQRTDTLPVFLQHDQIVSNHTAEIDISVHSLIEPDSTDLKKFQEDYIGLWAHLNHLYSTNDVVAGKEYYSEDWFKQLCDNYQGVNETKVIRRDIEHHLHIINWSADALVCTAIDSNVLITYQYPDNRIQTKTATIALALIYQGDHWRLDAMRILEEKEFINN